MYSKVISGVLEGIEASLVQVEADLSNGLPVFDMVGYLSSEVKEARERVRTAMKNQGYQLPPKRITVNLSPAHIRKSGSFYDLPIAMAILAAEEWLRPLPAPVLFLGELGLDGSIKKVQGVLSIVLRARKEGIRLCVIPEENRMEASLAEGICCVGYRKLKQAVDDLNLWSEADGDFSVFADEIRLDPDLPRKRKNAGQMAEDFREIKGQEVPRRAIEIAVSGHHNLLMSGPPGSGKTALARRIPTIMPRLTREEELELTQIYSICGLLNSEEGRMAARPFRAPHHTISVAALAGGGKKAGPGELTLADKGVLFLDELPEYNRHTLEVMRQPLEEGRIVVARSQKTCIYPADLMLVASMNPCPCGYFPDRSRCSCTENQIRRYQSQISGPLLDRIDLLVRVNPVSYQRLREMSKGESSADIQKRVERTRKIQRERFRGEAYEFNSRMNQKGLERYCVLSREAESRLKQLFSRYEISARGYERILKLARTIADMEQEEHILESHLSEAVLFRMGWDNE